MNIPSVIGFGDLVHDQAIVLAIVLAIFLALISAVVSAVALAVVLRDSIATVASNPGNILPDDARRD